MAVVVTAPEYKDFSRSPAIVQAAAANRLGKVKALIGQGVDINVKDKENFPWDMTALLYAAQRGYVEMVKLLITAGANVECIDRCPPRERDIDSKHTALHLAARSYASVVAILIGAGANVHAKTRRGCTPLMDANAASAALLLEAGAQVNVVSRDGETALGKAVITEDTELIRLLLGAGADVAFAEQHDRGLLRHPTRAGDLTLFNLLLAVGADVNARSIYGDTALHTASSHARADFVRELLLRGA